MNNLNLYLDLFHKKTIELIDLNNYIKVYEYWRSDTLSSVSLCVSLDR